MALLLYSFKEEIQNLFDNTVDELLGDIDI
jgi:hypothetical protein